jgi:hypothetical protein
MLVLLTEGIYDISSRDGLRSHDTLVHTKFHRDWFRYSEVVRMDTYTDTDSKVIS